MPQPQIIPPISPRTRRLGAREAILAIFTAAVVLVLVAGPSIRAAGEQMDDGPLRTAVLVVGKPAGWLGDKLPLADGGEQPHRLAVARRGPGGRGRRLRRPPRSRPRPCRR